MIYISFQNFRWSFSVDKLNKDEIAKAVRLRDTIHGLWEVESPNNPHAWTRLDYISDRLKDLSRSFHGVVFVLDTDWADLTAVVDFLNCKLLYFSCLALLPWQLCKNMEGYTWEHSMFGGDCLYRTRFMSLKLLKTSNRSTILNKWSCSLVRARFNPLSKFFYLWSFSQN